MYICRPKRISGVEKRTVNLCSVGGWCPHPPQFSQQKHIFTFHVEIFVTRYILFRFRNCGLEGSQFVPTHPIFVLENVTCAEMPQLWKHYTWRLDWSPIYLFTICLWKYFPRWKREDLGGWNNTSFLCYSFCHCDASRRFQQWSIISI